MPAIKNLVGNKYNSLTVLERAKNINGRVAWKCECDCGKSSIVRTGDLTTGHIRTCGKCNNVFDSVMYEFKDNYVIGHVKNGRYFLIDEEDLFKIKNYPISADSKGYVRLSINGEDIPLHRFLMNPSDDKVVDHKNRKPNDNRKNNLRVCTEAENMRNLSIAKNNKTCVTGVFKVKLKKKGYRYVAEITVNYKRKYLGYFKNFEDAIKARKEAELKYFGEFAPTYT